MKFKSNICTIFGNTVRLIVKISWWLWLILRYDTERKWFAFALSGIVSRINAHNQHEFNSSVPRSRSSIQLQRDADAPRPQSILTRDSQRNATRIAPTCLHICCSIRLRASRSNWFVLILIDVKHTINATHNNQTHINTNQTKITPRELVCIHWCYLIAW